MIQRAEKSLSSFYFWVTRLLVNFLCCSSSIYKSFCQISWQCDCELLFPVPSGTFLSLEQWDELFVLLFLLSSLGNTITQQQWYNLFVYVFENILFEKANKNAMHIRIRRHRRKLQRRWRARIARELYSVAARSKARKKLQKYYNLTLGPPREGWGPTKCLHSICSLAIQILSICVYCCSLFCYIQQDTSTSKPLWYDNCTPLHQIPAGTTPESRQWAALILSSPLISLGNLISQQQRYLFALQMLKTYVHAERAA